MLGLGVGAEYSSNTMDERWAIQMDGIDDALVSASNYNATFAGSFTINFWLKDITVEPVDSGATTLQNISGAYDTEDSWSIRIYQGGGLSGRLDMVFQSNADVTTRSRDSAFTTSDLAGWNMFSFVVRTSGTNDTAMEFYRNGTQMVTTPFLALTAANHAAYTNTFNSIGIFGRAGNFLNAPNPAIAGTYAEWGLWGDNLSQAALAALYNGGVPHDARLEKGSYNYQSKLKAYLNFENKAVTELVSGVTLSLGGASLVPAGY